MKEYLPAPQANQQLKNFSVLKIINLLLVVFDAIFLLGFLEDDLSVVSFVLPIHAIFLVPSIIFQVSPGMRNSDAFRALANLISIIVVVAGIINYFLMINEDDPSTFLLYYLVFIGFTLPGAIISASLLLLLIFGVYQPEPRLMMVPQEYQSIHTPMV